jgi:anti-anti-sigma factor
MLQLCPGWKATVERGPNCLFVRMEDSDTQPVPGKIAESLWNLMRVHGTNRLVLELDQVRLMRSAFLSELLTLRRTISDNDGVLRVWGLTEENRRTTTIARIDRVIPLYNTRNEAVRGEALTV